MSKKKKNTSDQFWQQHLEQLGAQNSADNFFIQESKDKNKNDFFDTQNDFFNSPFISENIEQAMEEEGQLSIDVYQTKSDIIIKAAMAGVSPRDLDISIADDVLTIQGQRRQEQIEQEAEYFYQECYWGKFSRSIVLPAEIKADKIKAQIKNGILTITLPKAKKSDQSVKIRVKEVEEED